MIYHEATEGGKASFEELLESTKVAVLAKLRYSASKTTSMSGNAFELLAYEEMCTCAIDTEFEGKLRHTSDREFPDIVMNGYYGVEVKATIKDAWTSIGNSVLESSRVGGIEKIYIFFGKLGGIPNIMFRNYEDCLKGIAVTHYPRYQIDMRLNTGDSIFDRMGVSYETISESNSPVSYVRKYYKSQMSEGDALWWIDDGVDSVPALSPVIRNYSSLEMDTKDRIKAELFILYPEVFSSSSNKYRKIPAYLASRYGIVCANVRDIFTAGGQVMLSDSDDNEFRVPQIIGELVRLAPLVEAQIENHSLMELANSWERTVRDTAGKKSEWYYELNKYTAEQALSIGVTDAYRRAVSDRIKIINER